MVLEFITYALMVMVHGYYAIHDELNILFWILNSAAWSLFILMTVAGYKRTKNLKSYLYRLLVLAVISQIPYSIFFENIQLNAIWTLIILICVINYIDKRMMLSALILSIIAMILPLTGVGIGLVLAVIINLMINKYNIDLRTKMQLPRLIKYAIYPVHFIVFIFLIK